MDMSKLPRMSQSPAPPPQATDSVQPTASRGENAGPRESVGAEVWISAALGVIFMIIGRTFAAYCIAKMTGRPFPTGVIWQSGPRAGSEVEYPDLEGFTMLTDASIFLFGLALVFDAVALFVASSARRLAMYMILFCLAVTGVMTAFNGYVVARLMSNGITPIISLLAVAFGVYIAIVEWKLLLASRTGQRPA